MKATRLYATAALATTLLLTALPSPLAQAGSHPAGACQAPFYVSGAGWDLCWQQEDARAQGLEINRAFFQGRSVIWKIGVPFSMTRYETPFIGPFKDTLGTPGAGGHPGYGLGALQLTAAQCPRFYDTGTLLNGNKLCVEQRGGPEPALALWARFNIFNYRFIAGYQFDSRGTVHPFTAMGGVLIDGNGGDSANNHFHHLYWRIDLDVGEPGGDGAQFFARAFGGAQLSGGPQDAVACQVDGNVAGAAWCDLPVEARLPYEHAVYPRWRVLDKTDLNGLVRPRSYELFQHSEGGPDPFGSFDVMVLQSKGDNTEIGYEVPTNPYQGDINLALYQLPPEPITDPVVWVALHTYHDTRDEDRDSMSYHYAGPELRPHNFFDQNPGEDTFP